jgi:CelD/BcsL family acetyltransferase involved in cellulose biosynthesis
LDALAALEPSWADLAERTPRASVFQTHAWNACWWKAFRNSDELLVILVYEGPRLAGVAPMMVVREGTAPGGTRRKVCFIGSQNHASDYCDFITDPAIPGALPALLDEIVAGGFDRIDLSHFPSHSPNRGPIMQYFARTRAPVFVETEAQAPVRILGDAQADRAAANKSSLKRHMRYFEKSGALHFHKCASEAEILGYLDAFFEQHKARRVLAGSSSQFCEPAQRDFYRDLVGALCAAGWLRFDVVQFDGAPLAFHFGFEYKGRFLWYKPTFDVRFADKSPGEVLIKFLLEDAIARGLEEFDFTVGSESFKYRFANLTRHNERIVVFRSAWDYWIYLGARRGKAMLKKLLRRDAPATASAQSGQ